jgi:hypothetical protein
MPDFTKVKIENELSRLNEKLEKARNEVYGRGAPGYNMKQYKVGSIPYERAKKAFGPAKAEFDKIEEELQPKINKLKNDLKQLETKQQKEKDTKKSKEDLTKAREELTAAKDLQDDAAIQKAEDKIERLTNKKGKDAGQSVKMTNAEQLANYIASAGTSIGSSGPVVQVTEPNKLDPRGNPTVYEAFLYVEPGTKGTTAYAGGQLVTTGETEKGVEFGTTDLIRDRYIKQLVKQYGSKQGLVDRLKEVGLLTTNKNVPSGAIDQALNQIIAEYTYEQVSAYKNYGVQEFPTLDEYMSNRPKGGGGSTTTTRTTTFSDTDFRALAQEVGRALYERELNPAELKKLQPILEKAQRKTPEVTTTTPGADGSSDAVSRRTGLNSQQFLIEELAKTDEAKATQMVGFYDVYKQMMGVQ